ncbi:hypothetical protein EAX61_00170 [Dokdonia sinensis]|uniref:T9SS C-terminal target domain-containing protein n=1 Tax=Dokdonia sinensis TaxID=2479847 RepID=A0A3M0GMA2_9FLAO|nr:hypothetical protein [Dokdonia sinensis]RMB63842.1 hypothetical protein EAX61_00170 [Dokdonia sinensis]
MRYIPILSFLLVALQVQCQDETNYGKLTYVSTLPELLRENSGMETIENSDLTYIINDSKGASSVFGVRASTGKIVQEIDIKNYGNRDWEDLTSRGNDLFIGDFGNNGNLRKNLVIYWISNVDEMDKEKVSAFAKAIPFTLEDQKKFPPKKKDRNYDIEAFFVKGDHLYLFTRNRSSDFDGTTNCYKLPIAEGAQVAKKIGSFKTCDDSSDCQVTSADYDPKSGKMVLLTYDKVFLFSDFEEDDFFNGKSDKIKLDYASQKESVYFKNAKTLIIGEESRKGAGGNIYSLKID